MQKARQLLSILLLLVVPSIAQATTHTATDVTRAAFVTALSGLTDGDTIVLPAGSGTYTEQVDIPACISIVGAGQGVTNITDNVIKDTANTNAGISHLFHITCNSPGTFHWHDFTLVGQAADADVFNKGHVLLSGTTTAFHIDHITWSNPQTSGFETDSCVFGLFDHMTWVTSVYSTFFLENIPNTCGGEYYGDYSWKTPISWGSASAIYVEDSTFSTTFGSTIVNQVIDGLAGQHVVFRHNTLNGTTIGSHGTDSGERQRGSRHMEIYNNDFTFTTDVSVDFMVWIRGGTGVVFNNHVHGIAPGSFTYFVKSENLRDTASWIPFGTCTGSSVYDGNTNSSGYRCVDQPGAGTSNDLLGAATPAASAVGNALDPIYIWSNTSDVTPHYHGGSINVIEDRDFYYSDDDSAARPGYSPYIYPHPLQSRFVSTTGNDSTGTGTSSSPWRTIEHGALQLVCGQNLFVREGTYNEGVGGGYADIPHCTSFSNAITIQAYPGEAVTITCTGCDSIFGFGTDIYPAHRNFYWILKNVTLDGGGTTIFPIGGLYGDYVRLDTVEVKNGVKSGILPHGDHWELLNVHSHHNGVDYVDHGFYMTGDFTLIDGGRYDHNFGYGIQFQGPSNDVIIRNATLDHNTWGLIFAGGSRHSAYNNLIYQNTNTGGSIAESGVCADCSFYGNTVVKNGGGIILGYPVADPCSDGGSVRGLVKNNIIWDNGGIDINVKGGFDAVLANNVIQTAVVDGGCRTTVTGTITGDPLFVTSPSDLSLASTSSSAYHAGLNLSSLFTKDFNGSTRTIPFDVGAIGYMLPLPGDDSGDPPPDPPCVPTHLAFILQPSSALLDASIGPVSVGLYSAASVLCTNLTSTITLYENAGTTWGDLTSADLSKDAVAGVATWTDLTVANITGSGEIAAQSPGLTGANSSTFTISAGPSPPPPAGGTGLGKMIFH